MDPSIISALIAAGTSIWSTDRSMKENETIRNREDNAFQRKVSDLEAAGLNKFNLSSQGASATPVKTGSIPGMEQIIPLAKLEQELKIMGSQNQLMKSQASYQDAMAFKALKDAKLTDKDLEWYDTKTKFGNYRDAGMGTGGFGVAGKAVFDMIKSFIPGTGPQGSKGWMDIVPGTGEVTKIREFM